MNLTGKVEDVEIRCPTVVFDRLDFNMSKGGSFECSVRGSENYEVIEL